MDAARYLLEPPGDAPEAQKTTRLDRKMPQSGSRHPGLFQSSQATVLELWASPDVLGPPGTQLFTSWNHLDWTRPRNTEAQKTTTHDRKMPQSESRHPGLFQSSQATVLELWASPDLLRPPWTQLDTSWNHLDRKRPKQKKAKITRRAFTCCFSYNAHRVIRKRKNDDLYLTLPKRNLG